MKLEISNVGEVEITEKDELFCVILSKQREKKIEKVLERYIERSKTLLVQSTIIIPENPIPQIIIESASFTKDEDGLDQLEDIITEIEMCLMRHSIEAPVKIGITLDSKKDAFGEGKNTTIVPKNTITIKTEG